MRTIFLSCLIALPLLADAQGVWRCGADGRSYASTPCKEGRMVETEDSRPAADVQAAVARAQGERRHADALAQVRLRDEAALRGNGLAGFADIRPAAPPPAKNAIKKKKVLRQLEADGISPTAARASRRIQG